MSPNGELCYTCAKRYTKCQGESWCPHSNGNGTAPTAVATSEPSRLTATELGYLDDPAPAPTVSSKATGPASWIVAKSLADVKTEPVYWLWDGYLPVGKLVTVQGDPGVSKSMFTVYCAARVSSGTPFYGANESADPAAVLIVSYEDHEADTIKPRAEVAGADMRLVFVLSGVEREDSLGRDPISLSDHIGELRAKIKATRARLLIIDPLGAAMGDKVDSYVDASVRKMLAPLSDLAGETGCTILLVRHLRKNETGGAITAGGGSIGITGAARVVLQIGKARENEAERVLAVVKCNVQAQAPSLRYRIDVKDVRAIGGDNVKAPYLEWMGTADVSADDLIVARSESGEERTAFEEARSWMEAELKKGSRFVRDVMSDGKDFGFSERTLQRAARDLKVSRTRADLKSPWLMSLPSHVLARPPVLAKDLCIGEDGENAKLGENVEQLTFGDAVKTRGRIGLPD